jgi:Nudix hydrolase domain
MDSLKFKKDRHGGVLILEDSLPIISTDFKESLVESLESWKSQGFKLAWLTLSKERLTFIPVAIELGFIFHHALDTQTMLVYRLTPNAFIPPYATHTSGAGAIVISPKNELLVVQENVRQNKYLYKLPGGLLEQHEHIEKSNFYFVCRLKPLSFDIQADGVEIEKALWMPLDEFYQSEMVSPFDKQIVGKTLKEFGFRVMTLDDVDISSDRLEIFLP